MFYTTLLMIVKTREQSWHLTMKEDELKCDTVNRSAKAPLGGKDS